jgi:hypothetical protein
MLPSEVSIGKYSNDYLTSGNGRGRWMGRSERRCGMTGILAARDVAGLDLLAFTAVVG